MQRLHYQYEGAPVPRFRLDKRDAVLATYSDLLSNRGHHLDIEETVSMDGVIRWLQSKGSEINLPVLDNDVDCATSAILIGGVANRDTFVARLPVVDSWVLLPPPDVVRAVLDAETSA